MHVNLRMVISTMTDGDEYDWVGFHEGGHIVLSFRSSTQVFYAEVFTDPGVNGGITCRLHHSVAETEAMIIMAGGLSSYLSGQDRHPNEKELDYDLKCIKHQLVGRLGLTGKDLVGKAEDLAEKAAKVVNENALAIRRAAFLLRLPGKREAYDLYVAINEPCPQVDGLPVHEISPEQVTHFKGLLKKVLLDDRYSGCQPPEEPALPTG